ncbi:Genome sequencing data, contig C327 (fragment) [Microcystis aeruginosa PCC 9807]|uniref:Genome sequencing data, contig C327 n=1 Tax=Microcystis aeruginosa PCC 9807 TaxID=1160283 RepID=I4HDS9_MICAE
MLIEDYFQQIQTIIATCSVVQFFTLDCEKRDSYEGFIRAEIKFIDNSVLHIREFVNIETIINRNIYAYQYMNKYLSKINYTFR